MPYMKKWWLNHTFQISGHNVEFRGWINTMAARKEDFPEMIYGTFWAKKDPEGVWGRFVLDDKSNGSDNFVFGQVYPTYLAEGIRYGGVRNMCDTERIIQSAEPLKQFPKFEARIEECVDLGSTYIVKY